MLDELLNKLCFKYFKPISVYNSDFMGKRNRRKELEKVCKEIEENMKDPEYVKAVYEFIRATSR